MQESSECKCCLELYTATRTPRLLSCLHEYCNECILSSRQCPECLESYDPKDVVDSFSLLFCVRHPNVQALGVCFKHSYQAYCFECEREIHDKCDCLRLPEFKKKCLDNLPNIQKDLTEIVAAIDNNIQELRSSLNVFQQRMRFFQQKIQSEPASSCVPNFQKVEKSAAATIKSTELQMSTLETAKKIAEFSMENVDRVMNCSPFNYYFLTHLYKLVCNRIKESKAFMLSLPFKISPILACFQPDIAAFKTWDTLMNKFVDDRKQLFRLPKPCQGMVLAPDGNIVISLRHEMMVRTADFTHQVSFFRLPITQVVVTQDNHLLGIIKGQGRDYAIALYSYEGEKLLEIETVFHVSHVVPLPNDYIACTDEDSIFLLSRTGSQYQSFHLGHLNVIIKLLLVDNSPYDSTMPWYLLVLTSFCMYAAFPTNTSFTLVKLRFPSVVGQDAPVFSSIAQMGSRHYIVAANTTQVWMLNVDWPADRVEELNMKLMQSWDIQAMKLTASPEMIVTRDDALILMGPTETSTDFIRLF